ncbi:efflux RND transporter permease subunit [Paenibacillus psychroresistens]|uniref:Efflux RND transporter permease subunit n=1 Tax=Paenibacillus psychroresistens TaxID=1778678 RepID=A0A6B8RSH1_9BACL|nr:efflux RND transporter permease subunit [Paenibacillus psychroresistens]QGQ99370.1 efflux RND transporter permease subunit [Paenibacillus psychroresistens]
MKSIIRFSMKNTVAIFILIFMLVGGGIYSIMQMKMEKYPQVDIPYLHISIYYPGASPEQVMQDIGYPLEQQLGNIDGLSNLYTAANPNVFNATLAFSMTASMEQGEKDAREAVAKFKLPDTAQPPNFSAEKLDAEVYTIAIYGGAQEAAQQVVEETLQPAIRSIDGIEAVNLGGIHTKKVFIRLLPNALLTHKLTLDQVNQFIQANNASFPIGDLKTTDQTLPIRMNNSLHSLEDIQNIPILTAENKPLKLSDIADITYDTSDQSITRIDGEPAVTLTIIPQGGQDAVKITKQAKEKVASIQLPAGLKTSVLLDRSTEIEKSVYGMLREVILGAIMAVLVTLLFLRNLRSTIIAVISIPLSMLASVIVLNNLGYTLNMMTLAGIAVAIGRVVDDSIVVIENVFRRVRSAQDRDGVLVENATREVSNAITSSTITTVAVFLPLAFVPGIVGKFFVPLAWTIVISLLFSLLVAVTVVPLMSRLFLLNLKHSEPRENMLQRIYRRVLGGALRKRWLTLTFAFLLLVSSIAFIAPGLGINFLPAEKALKFNIDVTMPIGTGVTKTEKVSTKIEDILKSHDEVELITAYIGSERAYLGFSVKDAKTDTDALAAKLRAQFKEITDAKAITLVGVSGGVNVGSDFSIVVNGPNLAVIKQATDQIITSLKPVPNLTEVRSSAEGEKPEISIDFDNSKLAANGLTPATVALNLHNMVDGSTITKSQINSRTTDVVLSMKMGQNATIETLKQQKISTPLGTQVALQNVGSVQIVKNPTNIARYNQADYLQIHGTITDNNTGKVTSDAEKAIRGLKLPEGVTWSSEGASKELNDGFINMGIALIISMFLVYMVMLIAFSDWKLPLVILVAIPFSWIGALLGLFIVHEPIGMPALIGILMLGGIVVTNAIVLLDRVKTNLTHGMAKKDALMEAGVTRIRPILMTAIATIGALLPLAISTDGGLISRALAVVVIGGLSTSTLLTLVIVPVIFSLVTREKRVYKPENVEIAA